MAWSAKARAAAIAARKKTRGTHELNPADRTAMAKAILAARAAARSKGSSAKSIRKTEISLEKTHKSATGAERKAAWAALSAVSKMAGRAVSKQYASSGERARLVAAYSKALASRKGSSGRKVNARG